MRKTTATISQYGEKIPYIYSLNIDIEGRDRENEPIGTCCHKLGGHYILGSRNLFLGCNAPDNSHHTISSQGSVTEFGIAHTAEEADKRLYNGIVQIALGFSLGNKDEDFELIDETHYAEKREEPVSK